MISALKGRLRRSAKRRKEVKSLRSVPPHSCDTTNLKRWFGGELAKILHDRDLDEKCELVEHQLDRICDIQDGQTGGVNPGDRRALYYMVQHLRPSSVLEIGTHVGASTCHLVARMSEGSVVTVDRMDVNDPVEGYWKQSNLRLSPQQMMERLASQVSVSFVKSDSVDVLENPGQCFDLIFLDGDHSAAMVYTEIPLALKALAKGGLIILHDYFPKNKPLWSNGSCVHGPHLAVKRLQFEGAPIRVFPLGALPWPTKQGSNVTSLAVLAAR
jgi:predicted O-methyltransferase YrrM